VRIEVLGSLTAREEMRSFTPSAGKHRQMLALLALSAGQVVPVSTLMEEIWGERPPRSAAATLQTYILQLRRRISSAVGGRLRAREVLATAHHGYLLDVDPGAVDAQEFERLVGLGRTALQAGELVQSSRSFARALRLWRGPALVDVQAGPLLEIEVLRLDEARLSVLEQRLGVELRLGGEAESLGELVELAARYPMHEGFHALLMVAQYRAGRAWQALATYQRLRLTLDAELGLAPSERLQRLHHAVLTAELPDTGGWGDGQAEIDRLAG
jgi:DNA-binding SARP family transcriptional activator